MADDLTGRVLAGRYRLDRLLAVGGMSRVLGGDRLGAEPAGRGQGAPPPPRLGPEVRPALPPRGGRGRPPEPSVDRRHLRHLLRGGLRGDRDGAGQRGEPAPVARPQGADAGAATCCPSAARPPPR